MSLIEDIQDFASEHSTLFIVICVFVIIIAVILFVIFYKGVSWLQELSNKIIGK